MTCQGTTAKLANRSDWQIVGAAFLVAMFGYGIGFYGPSVFLRTLAAQHGWSIATISAAISIHFLFGALLVAYLPEIHRRLGLDGTTRAGLAAAALGAVAWASARQPWQLFPAAVLSGAGWAATSGAAINAIVAPWFDKERPKALGLAFNGASVGGLVFAPLWVALIAWFGFVAAAALIGIAAITVLWPVSLRFLRPRPDGSASGSIAAAPTLRRADLLRDRRFVTIAAAAALGLFAQVGLFAHLVTRLAPTFGPSGAAWAISLTAICAVAGRSLLGWALGNRNRRNAAAINFLVQAGGTALLTFGSGTPLLFAGCVLFGLGVGNLVSLPPLIIQQEFAAGDVGRAVALTVAINQAVFAFAPATLGVLRDIAGDYTLAFEIVGAIQLAAALIVIAYRPRRSLLIA